MIKLEIHYVPDPDNERERIIQKGPFEPPVCQQCGTTDNLSYGPDPYGSEFYNDDTPVYLCDNCGKESLLDI